MSDRNSMIAKAISQKYPNVSWSISEGRIVKWNGPQQKPSDVEIEELYQAEVSEAAKVAYRERRAKEYPPIEDQLDAIWKGGQDTEAMRQQILAVKAKYPKP